MTSQKIGFKYGFHEWTPVEEQLPISGPDDPIFDSPDFDTNWFELEVVVLVNEKDPQNAKFYACYEAYHPSQPEDYVAPFLMEFDTDGVTHWRHKLITD